MRGCGVGQWTQGFGAQGRCQCGVTAEKPFLKSAREEGGWKDTENQGLSPGRGRGGSGNPERWGEMAEEAEGVAREVGGKPRGCDSQQGR